MRLVSLIPARLVALALFCGLMISLAPASRAEEEAGGDLKEKIRKQMEKIRELMKENEDALLDLSTGGKSKPKSVEVEVPTPPPGGSSSGSSSSGSEGSSGESGTSGGSKSGEEIRRKIDELIASQRGTSKAIPNELERLVKMIPL